MPFDSSNYSRGPFDSKTSEYNRSKANSSNFSGSEAEMAARMRMLVNRKRRGPMENCINAANPPMERYTMEGGEFGPLLPPERYRGRVLSASSLRRRRKPGLMVDRKVESNRPRVVVDGVDDLRDSFTGLLARRVDGLDIIPDTKDGPKEVKDDFLSMEPCYDFSKAQSAPVDDRITPHTLHTLLRNSRATIARLHPPSAKRNMKYYSFSASKNADPSAIVSELEAEMIDNGNEGTSVMKPESPKDSVGKKSPRKKSPVGKRPPLKKDSRMTVKGETPGEFIKRTACPTPEAPSTPLHPHSARPGRADYYDQFMANQLKEMQQNDIRHLEPPNLVLAHGAKYFPTARDDAAPPDGIGYTAPSVPLTTKHPVEKCTTYPPVPVRYASKEEEKRAMSLKRLAPREGVLPSIDEAKAPENEHVADLDERENAWETQSACDDGRTPEQGKFLEYTFTTASRGEDSNFIEQLVKGFTSERRKMYDKLAAQRRKLGIPVALQPTKKNIKQFLSSDTDVARDLSNPVFSVLDATLAVSKEFEKIKQGQHAHAWADSSVMAQDRREAVERLISFDSTRIPEQYWVSIQERNVLARNRAKKAMAAKELGNGKEDGPDEVPLEEFSHLCNASRSKYRGSEVSVLFPATKPVGRAQVYLLAETVDFMLSQNNLLDVLSDPTIAKQILPVDVEEHQEQSIEDAAVNNPLLVPEIQKSSQEAHLRYTTAAEQAVEVLDIGLVELVRQVGSFCVERGALLDSLRQALVDVANSNIRVLQHAKEVAFQQASERYGLFHEMRRLEDLTLEQAHRIRELEKEKVRLQLSNDSLQLKATRIDLLMERIEAKRKRYELHSEDEHACLLLELEEDMIRTASKAVTTVNEEKLALQDGPNVPSGEAPTAAEARKRVMDTKSAMQSLYTESARLLKELNECTISMNQACAPLYDKVSLSELSPNANLPAAKWAAIAHAIGEFEKDKSHRQRVFQVFTDWCDRFRKDRKEELGADKNNNDGDFLVVSSPDTSGAQSLLGESAASFMSFSVDHDAEAKKKKEEEEKEKREKEEEEDTVRLQFITRQDLMEMHVYDCSPEEVNAMFERKFDFKGFLHTPWEPSNSHFTLNLTDVADMVHDVRVFLEEITLRMRAMCNSAVMMKGIEPEMKPPAHPDIPCALCGRREMTGEKRKRQDALQSIAREVQHRIEELTRRFQKAESEREDARGEARRIQQELDASIEREEALKLHISEMLRQRHVNDASNLRRSMQASSTSAPPMPPSRSVLMSGSISTNGLGSPKQPSSMSSPPQPPSTMVVPASANNSTNSRRGAGNLPMGRVKRRRSFTEEMASTNVLGSLPADTTPKDDKPLPELVNVQSDGDDADELTLPSENTIPGHENEDVPERSKSEVISAQLQGNSTSGVGASVSSHSSVGNGNSANNLGTFPQRSSGTVSSATTTTTTTTSPTSGNIIKSSSSGTGGAGQTTTTMGNSTVARNSSESHSTLQGSRILPDNLLDGTG